MTCRSSLHHLRAMRAARMWDAHAVAAETILAARNAKHRENRALAYQVSCKQCLALAWLR